MQCAVIFDDKYTYEGDIRCFSGFQMDPLVENNIYFYAEVPPTILESYQTVTVRFAFNNEFAEYDYEANDYEQTLEGYDNLYEYTYSKDGASASADGNAASPEQTGEVAPTGAETQQIALGDTIVTDEYEFTLNNVELTYEA